MPSASKQTHPNKRHLSFWNIDNPESPVSILIPKLCIDIIVLGKGNELFPAEIPSSDFKLAFLQDCCPTKAMETSLLYHLTDCLQKDIFILFQE